MIYWICFMKVGNNELRMVLWLGNIVYDNLCIYLYVFCYFYLTVAENGTYYRRSSQFHRFKLSKLEL